MCRIRLTENRPRGDVEAAETGSCMKSALVLQAPLTEDYKNLADRSRDIIYHFHVSSGKFLFFNKKGLEIYGFGTKKTVLLKIHPEDREMVRRASRRALVPGCVMGEVEYRICLPNNCVRWMHDRWTVMRDAEGAPLAIEGIIRDNTDKKRIENKLQERERELAAKAKNLEDLNVALRVLLKRSEEDQREIGQNITNNVKELIRPYIAQLRESNLSNLQSGLLDILEVNLGDIISPYLTKMLIDNTNLTPMEIQVANLVRQGRTSKEIAGLLKVAQKTVENHRNHIRAKLKINGKKSNLRSVLLSYRSEQPESEMFPTS